MHGRLWTAAIIDLAAATLAALAVVASAPALAETPPFYSADPRERAIHACCVEASKYSMSTWQSMQVHVYRECMAAHGQIE